MGGNVKRIRVASCAAFGVIVGTAFLLCAARVYAYADECPSGGEHTYAAVIVLYPTEDQDGIRNYTCTKCSYSIDLPIPAVGHQWGAWVVDLEPTCTHEGHRWRECTKYPDHPHYEEETIPPLSATGDHAYLLAEDASPTCTDPGYRIYSCEFCGAAYQEELSPLGHRWGEWTVDREPSATEEGSRKRVCLHDQTHVEYESIPALGVAAPEEAREKVPAANPAEPVEYDLETNGYKSEKPATPSFYLQFGAIDAGFVAADVVIIAVFAMLSIPFVVRINWAQKHRAQAREMRSHREIESEQPEWLWWK